MFLVRVGHKTFSCKIWRMEGKQQLVFYTQKAGIGAFIAHACCCLAASSLCRYVKVAQACNDSTFPWIYLQPLLGNWSKNAQFHLQDNLHQQTWRQWQLISISLFVGSSLCSWLPIFHLLLSTTCLWTLCSSNRLKRLTYCLTSSHNCTVKSLNNNIQILVILLSGWTLIQLIMEEPLA